MKIIALILAFFISGMPVMAYDLDLSVDKEIEQKYNADKLNNKTQTSSQTVSDKVPNASLDFNIDNPSITPDNSQYKRAGISIPKWTTFKVRSNQKISDWSGVNSTVSFTTSAPVYKKNVTIQTGTVFKGVITKVHHPQITGNGALVEIKINSMTYNGKTIPVEGKITKANSELVFFNKIKGDRSYINGVKKKVQSANNFYSKSRQTSNKLSQNPVGTVISPIPTVVGFVGAAAATVVSPVTGLVEKGANVSFPAGTEFEIRLLENAYLN